MFSATMSPVIVKMMKQFQKNPQMIDVTHHRVNAPKIEQVYFEAQEKGKPEILSRLVEFHGIKLALVFCNTRAQVDNLVEELKARGYFAEGLHGDMSQKQRDKVMQGFRAGTVEILVATDVAGRGLDVNNVEAVFNYDLPRDDEDYVHRIGRTGRAGKSGIAFSFVTGRDVYKLKRIERENGVKIARRQVPTFDDIEETRLKNVTAKIRSLIDAGHLGPYINQTEKIMGDDYTAMDVAAALLKLAGDKKSQTFDDRAVFETSREEKEKPRHPGHSSEKRGKGRPFHHSAKKPGSAKHQPEPHKKKKKFFKDKKKRR